MGAEEANNTGRVLRNFQAKGLCLDKTLNSTSKTEVMTSLLPLSFFINLCY